MYARQIGIHGGLCQYSPHQATPLHLASQNGHLDTVQHLVGAGANLYIKDDAGVSECDYSTDYGLLDL